MFKFWQIPGNTRKYKGNQNKYFCNVADANDTDLKIRLTATPGLANV